MNTGYKLRKKIAGVDLNPVIISGSLPIIVDALFILKS